MKAKFFVIVYDNESKELADFIADNYHLKYNIIYTNIDHPKEKKQALMYKVIGGTKLNPFLALFNSELIIDALWEEEQKITKETIINFFKKHEN